MNLDPLNISNQFAVLVSCQSFEFHRRCMHRSAVVVVVLLLATLATAVVSVQSPPHVQRFMHAQAQDVYRRTCEHSTNGDCFQLGLAERRAELMSSARQHLVMPEGKQKEAVLEAAIDAMVQALASCVDSDTSVACASAVRTLLASEANTRVSTAVKDYHVNRAKTQQMLKGLCHAMHKHGRDMQGTCETDLACLSRHAELRRHMLTDTLTAQGIVANVAMAMASKLVVAMTACTKAPDDPACIKAAASVVAVSDIPASVLRSFA
jgi:hypothetical protein